MPMLDAIRRPSLRWRIGGFTALVLSLTLAALTGAAILEVRRVVLAIETETARSLLGHLITMPEFRSSRGAAEAHLAPLRDALVAAGVSVEIQSPGSSSGEGVLARESIALSDGPLELVYRMDPARLARIARRSAADHLILGAFDRLQESVLSTRNEQQKSILRPAERRHELRPVLDGQAAGRTGAHVNEPPAPFQSSFYRKSRPLDGRPDQSQRLQ